MCSEKHQPDDFQRVDPEDYADFEEQYIEKGSGGGKGSGHKGKKTIRTLKKQQRNQTTEQRRKEVEDILKQELGNLPIVENREIQKININNYCAWIEDNIGEMAALDLSECVITFTKSGGPGGQNVNKRETKVMIVHKPTNIRVESDQTRSQMQNKNLAQEILRERLQDHLDVWKEYLKPDQHVDIELVMLLLD